MAGRTAAPAGETKAGAFKRLGTNRINNAVKSIDLLAGLANKSSYEYTSDQVKLIEKSLAEACQRVSDAFAGKATATGGISL